GNTVSGHTNRGVLLVTSGGTAASLQYNTFSGNGTGVQVSAGDLTFTNNTFSNSTTAHGLLSVNGALTYSGNTASGSPRLLSPGGIIQSGVTTLDPAMLYGSNGS